MDFHFDQKLNLYLFEMLIFDHIYYSRVRLVGRSDFAFASL